MKKVLISRAGGYEELQLVERPTVEPGRDEVRIRVEAIGVNYADCVVRMGLYESARTYVGWPITPGFEVAGTIEALGEDVEDLELDQAVLAVTRFGGYSSELVVHRAQIFDRPRGWSVAEAAGLPSVALTAWYALSKLAHPEAGERVLVHSAAGGVGGSLVQQARIAGARVVGVVGAAHKLETVRQLGAERVIDKSLEDLESALAREYPGGFDVICDANGASTLQQSYDHLAPGGRLVVYGFHSMLPREGGRPSWLKLGWDYLRTPRFNPLRMTSENRSVLAFNLSFLFHRHDVLGRAMAEILRWAEEGSLTPAPVREYPLSRVADAHRDLESGQTVGKLVLRPDPDDGHA
ncbi:MAG: zinc-binding dehydrogenase [Myxococcales bacterium]|nr:zinc-binding dehydrogenase [Myxococcales bacterium]